MVVKITSLTGNGHQNYKFNMSENRSGILLYCAATDAITCARKSREDEKQLIDLEWPNASLSFLVRLLLLFCLYFDSSKISNLILCR